MKRLIFLQSLILWSLSFSIRASEVRSKIKEAVETLDQSTCVEKMELVSHTLDRLSIDDYRKELYIEGHETLLHDLFELKINIHERLRSFYRSSGLKKECADASRFAFKAIRTTEDYISENYLRARGDSIKFPDNAFIDENLHVRRHPDFANFDMLKDLKSGDILLTRGNAFTSAAIASLGEFDTQFSHMSMVYRDDSDKLWTVEAHIEVGSFVRPIEDHIKDKNYRTMLFRYEDERLAAKAAHYIFHKVKKASESRGNILYDFGFDQDDNESLFCSEIASYALKHVSKGELEIPMFRSRLFNRKPEFVKMLGIKAEESFVPADIEVDPRFKIISEWRDANKTNDNLQKDAVLHAMYSWNDKYGYQMRQASSGKSLLYRNVAWPMRRVPVLKKYFKDKLPINMSRQLIGYFGVLESVGEMLQNHLKVIDAQVRTQRGIPLFVSEKAGILEEFRLEDLQSVKKRLHKMYRPLGK
jgi:hypothetical protein